MMSPFEIFALFDDDDSGLIDFDESRECSFYGYKFASSKLPPLVFATQMVKEIDYDEFAVALFICDPTGGNPVGFTLSPCLTPTDAFETFDEAKMVFSTRQLFMRWNIWASILPTTNTRSYSNSLIATTQEA